MDGPVLAHSVYDLQRIRFWLQDLPHGPRPGSC